MAVLKDLIVQGTSRFINTTHINDLHANTIAADSGYFNYLKAVNGDITNLTTEELLAQNATVVGLLDVKGELHTNSWTNSSIATIDGSFYICPTISGVTSVTITRAVTSSTTTWSIQLNGTLAIENSVYTKSSTGTAGFATWTSASKVAITGEVLVNDVWMPLGTLLGTISSPPSTTAMGVSGLHDNGNEQVTLEAIGPVTGAQARNIKISLYEFYQSSAYRPIGIYLTSTAGTTAKTFIDIYGGGNAVSTATTTVGGTTYESNGLAAPNVRIGNLLGCAPFTVGTNTTIEPTGWGIYTDNGYFKGTIASNSGIIGNFNISTALYSGSHSAYNTNAAGIYIGDTYVAGGPRDGSTTDPLWYLKSDGSAKIGKMSITSAGVITATEAVLKGVTLQDAGGVTRAKVDTSGLTVFDGSGTATANQIATFGSLVQIGKSAEAHINLTSGGLEIFKNTTLISHLGYGKSSDSLGSSSSVSNTSNIPYFTFGSRATGNASYASSYVPGINSVVMGQGGIAQGNYSVSMGYCTEAIGNYSFAAGTNTFSIGDCAYTEGSGTIARGSDSHAGGMESETLATAPYSFVHGEHVIAAARGQAVFGKFNEQDSSAMFVVGNGTGTSARSNLMSISNNLVEIGNKNSLHFQMATDNLGYYVDTTPVLSLNCSYEPDPEDEEEVGSKFAEFKLLQSWNPTDESKASLIMNYAHASGQPTYCRLAAREYIYASQTNEAYIDTRVTGGTAKLTLRTYNDSSKNVSLVLGGEFDSGYCVTITGSLIVTGCAGMILMYGGSTAPRGWLLCNGQAVGRTAYAALFAAIGTTFGAGDGSTTFNVPDLRGRVAIGVSSSHALASTGGAETVTLTAAQSGVPAHKHSPASLSFCVVEALSGDHTQRTQVATSSSSSRYAVTAKSSSSSYLSSVAATANNTTANATSAHTNMQPFTTVNYIICTGRI